MANPRPDETDLQILAELDLNGRATAAEIGRKMNLSRKTINSRIRYLEGIGLITRHSPIIDFFGLGYLCHRLYFRLQHTNRTIENELMEYLSDSPLTRWCGFTRGGFDIECASWVKAPGQLKDLLDDFKSRYQPYIKESQIISCCGEVRSSRPFTKEIFPRQNHDLEIGANKLPCIDQTDVKILKILSSNGRGSYSTIGKAVGLTPAAVKYRVDKLVANKVIAGFRPLLELSRAGYTMYKAGFNLESLKNKKRIEQYALRKSGVINIQRSIGGNDLEMTLRTKTAKEMANTLHEIKDEFFEDIRDLDFFAYEGCAYKESFMPDF